MKKEFIFPIRDDSYECHASTILKIAENSFLAAFFEGTKEKDDDVKIKLYKKENGEWFFNTKQLSALGLKAYGGGLGEKINLTFDTMTDSDEIFVF